MEQSAEKLYKNLPEAPGIYLMRDKSGGILYIGKAGNLRRRVSSYFMRPQEVKTEELLRRIAKIDYEKTETAIEALILEARRIREHEPRFNVKEKDGKSFLWVEITKEKFPRVLLVRGLDVEKDKSKSRKALFGPFTSASSIREALRIIRRIFPYSTHNDANAQIIANDANTANKKIKADSRFADSHVFVDLHRERRSRPCFDYEIGLCPGTCIGVANRVEYLKNIRNIRLFFEGKKKRILRSLTVQMSGAARKLNFEHARKLRGQIFALQHIQDIALLRDDNDQLLMTNDKIPPRIEGYDISNTSGMSATGSMVVFTGGKPDKNEYRKFKIKTIMQSDDVGMLKEVLRRRLKRVHTTHGWALPHLILIDGGRGQVNAAQSVVEEAGLKIPIVGIAKGSERKKNEFIGEIPEGVSEKTLIDVRNEAHRFAVSYHKKLRGREFLR